MEIIYWFLFLSSCCCDCDRTSSHRCRPPPPPPPVATRNCSTKKGVEGNRLSSSPLFCLWFFYLWWKCDNKSRFHGLDYFEDTFILYLLYDVDFNKSSRQRHHNDWCHPCAPLFSVQTDIYSTGQREGDCLIYFYSYCWLAKRNSGNRSIRFPHSFISFCIWLLL